MKRKAVNLAILLVAFTMLSSTCQKKDPNCYEGSHKWFTYNNRSSRSLIFQIYWNYPDTTIGSFNPTGAGILLPADSRTRGAGPGSCWESVLKDGKKENIYIFDEDSLEAIPWDVVRATNRGLLERRVIDLEYLQANDFTVTYQ